MRYKQFLTPEQIKRIVAGEKEETITVSVDLTLPELENFCSFLRLSRGFEEAEGGLVNYPDFEKCHGLANTYLLMEAMSRLELAFCAAAKGMTIDQYITEHGD